MIEGGRHLAQINIGRLRAPTEAVESRDFMDNLAPINALAEAQPGFVWRLTGEGDDATDIKMFDDPLRILNMSVWTDVESLAAFVYRTRHRDFVRRRDEWFHATVDFMALWWIEAGHTPTPEEGMARLDRLRRLGPTAEAFTFKSPFPAIEAVAA